MVRKSFVAIVGLVSLLSACATTNQKGIEITPTTSSSLRIEGFATMRNSVIGSQTVNFSMVYADLYGTRLDLVGPTGPLLFTVVRNNGFEAYSVPEKTLIRDNLAEVVAQADRSLISVASLMLAAIGAYTVGFGEDTPFNDPLRTSYGYKFSGESRGGAYTVQWRETPSSEMHFGQLDQIILDSGFALVYANRHESGMWLINIGDGVPILEIMPERIEPNISLAGITWQLLIPPGSDVLSFRQYISRAE